MANPDSPRNFIVTASRDGTVTMSWQVPTSDGGSPIIAYNIVPNPNIPTGGYSTVGFAVTDPRSGCYPQVNADLSVSWFHPATVTQFSGNIYNPSVGMKVDPTSGIPIDPTNNLVMTVVDIVQNGNIYTFYQTSNNLFFNMATGDFYAVNSTGTPTAPYVSPISLAVVTAGSNPLIALGGDGSLGSTTLGEVFTGLINGISYTFSLTVSTILGRSVPVIITATPSTIPTAPQNCDAVPFDSGADLTWSAPANNGGAAITGYTIVSVPAVTNVTVGGGTTSTRITGLTNGTSYIFKITAINSQGSSISASTNGITPPSTVDTTSTVSAGSTGVSNPDVFVAGSSSAIRSPYNGMNYVLDMDDGTKVVFIEPVGTPNTPQYYVSSDVGSTWVTKGALPNAVLPLHDSFFSKIIHPGGTAIDGSEKQQLAIWKIATPATGVTTGVDIQIYTADWNPVSKVFQNGYSQGYIPFNTGGTGIIGADAVYANGLWHLALVNTNGTATGLYAFATNGTPTSTLSSQLYAGVNWAGVAIITPPNDSTMVYICAGYNGSRSTYFFPLKYNGSYVFSSASIETVTSQGAVSPKIVYRNAYDIDIIYSLNNTLYTQRRIGTNSYTGVTYLAPQNPNTLEWSYAYDQIQDIFHIYYNTDVNYLSGEIYTIERTNGLWQLPTKVVGDYALGFSWSSATPEVAATQNHTVNLVYLRLTNIPGVCDVYYSALAIGAAPNTPIIISPPSGIGTSVGYYNSATPTFEWTYSNSAPYDTQSAFQVLVQHMGTSGTLVTDWDSGQVASTDESVVYSGPGLVGGSNYQWIVRTWDSIQNNGAGAVGPYSSPTTFQIVSNGGLIIDHITVGGVLNTASPITISGPNFQTLAFTWTQPDEDFASKWRIDIYDSTGVNWIDGSGDIDFSPNNPPILTPGGSVLSNPNNITINVPIGTIVGGVVTKTGEGRHYSVGNKIKISEGSNSEIFTITQINNSSIVAQPDATHLTIAPGEGAKFLVGDTITVGATATLLELLTITAVADTSLTVSTMSYTHIGETIYGNRLTMAPLTNTYTSAAIMVGYFETPAFTPSKLVNNTSYKLELVVTDGVSNTETAATAWTINTVWAPALPINGVSLSQNVLQGSLTIQWVNPANTAGNHILTRPSGTTTWRDVYKGPAVTHITLYPALGAPFDYDIRTVTAAGVEST